MIKLSREIRFALSPPVTPQAVNSWAAWPATDLIAPHLVLRCVVSGDPHPQTGYLCNIKLIDDLLRSIVIDRLIPEYKPGLSAAEMLAAVYDESLLRWSAGTDDSDAQPAIESITLAVSPHLTFEIRSEHPEVTESNPAESGSTMMAQTTIRTTQQFEFSASHRLHCADLSDDENRDLFGKCNNPNGHGHNYVIAVTLRGHLQQNGTTPASELISLAQFESTVKRLVIDRLDHKHLNRDIDYFETTIPTVENIAIAIWNWLNGNFGTATLDNVRVYETPKTWAEYCGE